MGTLTGSSARALVLLVAVLAAVGGGCSSGRGSVEDRTAEVERRVLSPCCYMEPLLTHASPLATELRAEIAARIRAGEAPGAVEAALVSRYGERVRALPPGLDLEPFGLLALTLPVLLALLGLALWRRGRRRRARAGPASAGPPLPALPGDDDLRERLDDELAALD